MRADVREHGAWLKRVPYIIDKQYSSSAAACNGASPTDGARQQRVIHHRKQQRLVARVRPFLDKKHKLYFGSLTNSRYFSSGAWPISDLFRNVRKKRRVVQNAIRTGCAAATRRLRQAAARLAFHCAHRIDTRFCESPLRLVHGRRTSCVDRVPSASKKQL
jgi:hypothetical protein